MQAFNSVTFGGNVGRDAELKYLANGTALADWSLAVNSKRKDGQETTIWINCKMFGNRAEAIAQYITKGKGLLVQGRFAPNEWTGDEGKKHSRSEFVINEVAFADSAPKQGQRRDDLDDDLPFE